MTIRQTTERGLCCGCGACRVVCPRNAIEISYDEASGQFLPSVDAHRCSDCAVCLKCCPSANLPDVVSTGKKTPVKTPPLAVYAAYAKDRNLRWNSTSGGVCTALVERLLSEGVHKRAFVVRYDKFDGTQAELAPFESPADVRRAAKSKYVPVSVGRVIEAIKVGGLAGSIVVCTPCQLRAIRAALRHYGASDEDVLFIGLFCQSMLDYRVYAHYEREYGGYDTLHFRDKEPNGWPGDTSLVSNGEMRKVDRKVRMELKKTHTTKCCMVCTDKLNEDADISVGDCYIPGFRTPDGFNGVSSVAIRTKKGEAAFEACKSEFIRMPMAYDMVRSAQQTIPDEEREDRVFNVCIIIIGIRNRGQGLMLEAILEQVRGHFPNARIFVDERAYNDDPEYYRKRSIQKLRSPCEMDLVFFEPGFTFSDVFKSSPSGIDRLIAFFKSFDKPGRKIVFLPQAFGPFAQEDSLRLLRGCVKPVDLVFAREKASFAYLKGALGDDRRIVMAPDFTCLYHVPKKTEMPVEGPYVVVVPNVKMLTKTDEGTGRAYKDCFKKILAMLLDAGRCVVLLNHSGDVDKPLLEEFNLATGGKCKVLDGLDAGSCKAVLGGSELAIVSRYHAFVSALTEGIPALCTSWSHKYEELVEELGVPQCCIDIRDEKSALETVRNALAKPTDYVVSESCRAAMRSKVYQMWDRIFKEAFPKTLPDFPDVQFGKPGDVLGLCCASLVLGGLERSMTYLIPMFQNHGINVVLLTDIPPSDLEFPTPEGCVRVVIGREPAVRTVRIRRAIRKYGISKIIFQAYYSKDAESDIDAAHSVGARAFVHHRSVFSNMYLRDGSEHMLPKLLPAYRKADALLTLSRIDARFFSVMGCRAFPITNPVPMIPPVEVKDEPEHVIVWVAHFNKGKRPLDAVKIAEQVQDSVPDIRLVMLGGGNESLIREVRDYLEARPRLKAAVDLVGAVQDVFAYERKAGVFLTTTMFEGFSHSIVEAKALGLPVVTYSMPYLETIVPGSGVAIVPQGDVGAAAAEIVDLFNDRERYRALSRQARASYEQLAAFDQWAAYSRVFSAVESGRGSVEEADADRVMMQTLIDHVAIAVDRLQSKASEADPGKNGCESSLREAVAKRDAWLKEKTARLAEAREAVAKRDRRLAEKVAEFKEAIEARDRQLAAKNELLKAARESIVKRDLRIEALKTERQAVLGELRKMMSDIGSEK